MHCGVDLRRAEPQGTIGDPRKHGVKKVGWQKIPASPANPKEVTHMVYQTKKQHSFPKARPTRPSRGRPSRPNKNRGFDALQLPRQEADSLRRLAAGGREGADLRAWLCAMHKNFYALAVTHWKTRHFRARFLTTRISGREGKPGTEKPKDQLPSLPPHDDRQPATKRKPTLAK